MVDSTERLINLAFALAHARHGLTRQQIRDGVRGYPEDQDEAAFARMFERDKKWLRSVGLAIETLEDERYVLDAESTFATSLDLNAEEAAMLRAIGYATASDPAFPFSEELGFALAKLATGFETPDSAVYINAADEQPSEQATMVGAIDDAVMRSKEIRFAYTNAQGEHKQHRVEPYGLYFRLGRWYMVGRDVDLDAERTYAVTRMANVDVNARKPESADFERPEQFDVAETIALPFQYGGGGTHTAEVRFPVGVDWRAGVATAGKGGLSAAVDGGVVWTVDYRSGERFGRWVIENGPGPVIDAPAELRELMRARLERVVAMHGRDGER